MHRTHKPLDRELRIRRATDRDILAAHVSEWSRTNARTIDGAARAYHRAMLATAALRDMGDNADDD